MDNSPHTSNFVTVCDSRANAVGATTVRLHYLDWGGSGPALLFLAGRGCNSHIFDELAPCFTGFFHVLALDRRGHGDSEAPESGYDIDTLTEDIRGFLDCLGIERVILAGHSLAGIELTHFASRYPERVQALVYLEAAYDYACPEYQALIENNPARKIQIPGADQDFCSIADYAAFIQFAYPTLGAIWGELLDEHLQHSVEINARGIVVDKAPEHVDLAISVTLAAYLPEYEQIHAPILAIYAVKKNTYYVAPNYMTPEQQTEMIDYFNHVAQPWNSHSMEQFRQAAPHARIVEIPEGHHYCFIQQEHRVFRAMMDFLLGAGSVLFPNEPNQVAVGLHQRS